MKSAEERLRENINKANKIHCFKYDYSLVKEYKNNRIKHPIICHEKDEYGNEHGVFYIDFDHHINRKQGCKKCAIEYRSILFSIKVSEFLKRAKEIHKGKYKYPHIEKELKNTNSKITCICPIHNEFTQRVNQHLQGHGCRMCAGNEAYNTETVIKKFKEIHPNDNYDYSEVVYTGYENEVKIGCGIHGAFWQTPGNHINGCGCPNCGLDKIRLSKLNNTEDVIKKCKEVHNNFYSYENAIYKGNKIKFNVTCPIHGDFPITPDNHLQGKGCPSCRKSKLEVEIECFLNKNEISFIPQCNKNTFGWLGLQSIDFYLPKYNIAIECQGEQHFIPFEKWGGEKTFNEIVKRDERKFKLCEEHNILVLYYSKHKPSENYKDKLVFSSKKELLYAIYNKINV